MFKTQLIGHIGQDATVKQVAGTQQLAILFSVAHSERWKDAQGVQHERTTWVACTYWREPGKTNVAEYMKAGTQVFVEGTVKADSYINKESGELVQKLALRVYEIKLLGSAPKKEAAPQGHLPNTQAQPAYVQAQQVQAAPPAAYNPLAALGAIAPSTVQDMNYDAFPF